MRVVDVNFLNKGGGKQALVGKLSGQARDRPSSVFCQRWPGQFLSPAPTHHPVKDA
ncbi:MAG: hypothetical protein ACO3NZ_13430 [Pirellulales bacterium]